ncbi:MAG TPA: CHAT domain-containing protein [Thermoanaerobaculia bacterium]|jgi:CHAT domain-containing protein
MALNIGLRSLIGFAALLVFLAPAAPLDLDHSYQSARAAYDHGDYAKAWDTIETALASGGRRDDEIVCRLRVLGALAQIRLGDFDKVLALAEPELPPALRRSDLAVERFRALAIASYKKGRLADAKRYNDQAKRLAEEAHRELLPKVLLGRANMTDIYDARTLERDMRELLRVAKRSGDVQYQTLSLGTLSKIAASQERFDEAIDFGQRTLELAAAAHDDTNLHRTEGNLGWYFNELGDRESAEEHLRAAIEIATRLHAEDNRVVYLLQLGEDEMSRGDLASARRDVVTARDLALKLHSKQTGNAMLSVAEVAFLSGDMAGAAAGNADALHFNEKVDKKAVLRSRILDARIAMEGGKLDDARATLEQVLKEAEEKSVRWEAELWLAHVYAARNDATPAELHFRNAIETVDEVRREVRKSELRISVPDLATQLYDDYIEFLVRQGNNIDALRVAELNRARTLAEGLQLDRNRKFDPARAARDANVVALSYHLGHSRSFLWAIGPGGVALFELPPAETIEKACSEYQQTFATARGTLQSHGILGEKLYQMLVAPAAKTLHGASRVAIIPDGVLAAFNFETLVVPSPRRYWIEAMTIETAPSLELLAHAHNSGKPGRLLLVGNSTPPDRAFPPLAFADEEMQRVKKHFGDAKVLAGKQATPRAYLASAPESYAFIHFVAHGVATQQHPLDSAVVLAGDAEGYKLYARDVIAHRVKARLVTISSCHGAGRRTYRGEGLVGLAWAFLGAGAHEVIAALWEVNDRATPDLMDSMYGAIQAGHDPVDALRTAKLKLLRSGTIYRKPFYWAPFVVYTGS